MKFRFLIAALALALLQPLAASAQNQAPQAIFKMCTLEFKECSEGSVVYHDTCTTNWGFGCKICDGETHVNDQCQAIEANFRERERIAANWMTEVRGVQERSLSEITLPGAHDAAMSQLRSCTFGANSWNTKTQKLSITDMLKSGVRYFDIRPLVIETGSVTHIAVFHGDKGPKGKFVGCWDDSLIEVMREFASFANAHPQETILIEISHITRHFPEKAFHNVDKPSDEQYGFIKEILVETLGGRLTENYPDLRTVFATPLVDLTAVGNVIVMVDSKNGNLWSPQQGIFFKNETASYKRDWNEDTKKADPFVYDNYSNAAYFPVLLDGGDNNNGNHEDAQHVKMEKALEDGLYAMMSWTLTQPVELAVSCGLRSCPYPPGTLEEMASDTHKYLPDVLKKIRASRKYPNVISLDYIDRVQAEKIFDLNRR